MSSDDEEEVVVDNLAIMQPMQPVELPQPQPQQEEQPQPQQDQQPLLQQDEEEDLQEVQPLKELEQQLERYQPQDGESVTDLQLDDHFGASELVGSTYRGKTSWCDLASKGVKVEGRELAEGEGMLDLVNGKKYVGSFKRGRRHGNGVWYDGDIYTGQWRDDVPHGKGYLKFGVGGYVEGDFVKWAVHGHATKEFSNGTKYVGQFANDEMHGAGKMYDKDGVLVRDGKWDVGKQVDPLPKTATKRKSYVYADHVRGCIRPSPTTALPCRYLNSVRCHNVLHDFLYLCRAARGEGRPLRDRHKRELDYSADRQGAGARLHS